MYSVLVPQGYFQIDVHCANLDQHYGPTQKFYTEFVS